MAESHKDNVFLTGSLGRVFARTAAPIILMMLVNGSFNLVDAYFLGVFVGADALSAVTSMFPAFMLMVALSTLVSNGFASVMARRLGAGDTDEAKEVFAQAITLSLLVCAVLIGLFAIAGKPITLMANNGAADLAQMSYLYIAIVFFGSPLAFILSINGDSLRCEGHIGFMALVSLSSVLLNAVLNYLLIAQLGLGVAGSALGTVLAQALSIVAVFAFRRVKPQKLTLQVVSLSAKRDHWREYLSLGAPSSLTYIGVALMSGAILFNIQQWHSEGYNTTVSAYGIVTRLTTFIYLPLLGLSMAFQSISGNNIGAKNWQRTNSSIKIALTVALVYCLGTEVLVWVLKDSLGSWFVNDHRITEEVARIVPVSTLALFLLGPLMMVSMFFQSIGDALRAALLGLAKIYLFALPMVFLLPLLFGEWGIWYAAPVAEAMALVLTLGVLYQRARVHNYRLGLFYAKA